MDGATYMKRCIELAQKAKGHTAPNPMVGAVLVHEGHIIGEGWHRNYGSAHAEVNCLDSVKPEDKRLIPQSTMYVNLEPCAHQGITPPCAVRLTNEPVKRVVIANTDPYEKVSGKGIAILREFGIPVETGVLEQEGLWLNRRFFCAQRLQRPYIILKWAQTREGYMAPADKSRFQISNTHSRELVHKWRTEEGAVMVGTNTAMNDDPELTARLWTGKQPLRVVLDKHLKIPQTHKLFNEAAATWVINAERETLYGNIHSIKTDFDDALLSQILLRLHGAKILSLIVEGGATLLQSFIKQGLWDEARVFTGAVTLPNGITAPHLTNAVHAFAANLEDDMLNVYVNNQSAYPYVNGMEL